MTQTDGTLPTLTAAAPHDRDRVIRTVVAAFAADPAFRWFFPDDATYAAHATTFTGYLFDRRVAGSTVWLADDAAAVALWDAPTPTASAVELVLPAEVMARLDAYHDAVHPLLPTTPYWYLGILATHPEHAGRRLGRALLAAGVERAQADAMPACLETTNPRNVELYQRAGWAVTASTSVDGLPVWVLTHP